MKTIWKFTLQTNGVQEIELTKGAEILTVQVQNKKPQIWVLLDTSKIKVFRKILIIGTGHPISKEKTDKYIGTYQLINGIFINHVFDLGEN